MTILSIDIETYSSVELKTHGVYKFYLNVVGYKDRKMGKVLKIEKCFI